MRVSPHGGPRPHLPPQRLPADQGSGGAEAVADGVNMLGMQLTEAN